MTDQRVFQGPDVSYFLQPIFDNLEKDKCRPISDCPVLNSEFNKQCNPDEILLRDYETGARDPCTNFYCCPRDLETISDVTDKTFEYTFTLNDPAVDGGVHPDPSDVYLVPVFSINKENCHKMQPRAVQSPFSTDEDKCIGSQDTRLFLEAASAHQHDNVQPYCCPTEAITPKSTYEYQWPRPANAPLFDYLVSLPQTTTNCKELFTYKRGQNMQDVQAKIEKLGCDKVGKIPLMTFKRATQDAEITISCCDASKIAHVDGQAEETWSPQYPTTWSHLEKSWI